MSTPIRTRIDFQWLARERAAEAQVLLDAGKWNGAYYLAGYAVELALKACIIQVVMTTDSFPDKNFSKDCYTHSLERLVQLARLEAARLASASADPLFEAHWFLVKDWSEEKRYHRVSQAESENMLTGVVDPSHGVLPWVMTHW